MRMMMMMMMMQLSFLYKLAAVVSLCAAPTGGYVFQSIADCEFGDNVTDMVYLVKNVFNQQINTLYDSRVGKYVGFGEFGWTNAQHYNNQSWKMRQRKSEVETLCRYHARLFRRITLDRKVPPIVHVRQAKPADYGERGMLECSAMGFFPREVKVSWLRDGAEVANDVSSTDVLANGDWSFQLHSYLELTARRGERVSCRVEHSSLQDSMEVDWDTSALDSKYMKKTLGIVSFFFGFAAAVGGAIYYWRKKRFDFSPLGRQEQPPPPCHLQSC